VWDFSPGRPWRNTIRPAVVRGLCFERQHVVTRSVMGRTALGAASPGFGNDSWLHLRMGLAPVRDLDGADHGWVWPHLVVQDGRWWILGVVFVVGEWQLVTGGESYCQAAVDGGGDLVDEAFRDRLAA
jgi:hypothetical protein